MAEMRAMRKKTKGFDVAWFKKIERPKECSYQSYKNKWFQFGRTLNGKEVFTNMPLHGGGDSWN